MLTQFLDSNLEHVSNKSAYLCGVMKTYRQKSRGGTSSGVTGAAPLAGGNVAKGPDEDKIKVGLCEIIQNLAWLHILNLKEECERALLCISRQARGQTWPGFYIKYYIFNYWNDWTNLPSLCLKKN